MTSITGRVETPRAGGAGGRTALRERHLRVVGEGSPSSHPRSALGRRPDRPPVAVPLRLTARGRFVVRAVLLVGLVLAMVVAVLVLDRPAQAGTQVQPVTATRYVVQPGETLWDIAGRVAPDVDRRDTVLRIVELNALPSSAVRAGEQIALPPSE